MKKRIVLNILFGSSLLISVTSYTQKALPYIVDSAIQTTVDENIKLTMFPAQSAMKTIETLNDTASAENYGLGKNFGAITQASLNHDTIFITSFLMAREASFGYKIILTRDSCIVKYFSLADENIFKINKTDEPKHLITLTCQVKKLTLSQKPQFKVGEVIEGAVKLTTSDFWSVSNGHDTKIKTQLTGYFKTNLLQFEPDENDIFKQIQ